LRLGDSPDILRKAHVKVQTELEYIALGREDMIYVIFIEGAVRKG